nr:hypothetical protein pA44BH1_p33 [Arthrobacter sp.]AXV46514.1 HtH domain protein [Arthrobacter sp.]
MPTSLHTSPLCAPEITLDCDQRVSLTLVSPATPTDEVVSYRPCRVSRKQERSKKHIKNAVPPGSMRAAHGLYQALPELSRDERLAARTRPFQRRLLGFFEKLISMTDYDTMTVRVPWGGRVKCFGEADARPGLAEWLGISRRTVANYLTLLHKWGYLGTVASGRSAVMVREKDAEGNELPVYVICIPSTLAAVPDALEPADVDKTCTPTAPLGVEPSNEKKFLTRTRTNKPQKGHGYAVNFITGGASAAVPTFSGNRTVPHWPAHATTKRRGQRWAAAAEIRHRHYALRPLSAKDLASVLKPWLKAGWTVSDIMNAIDRKPDGSQWPHDGAPVTRNTQRLREWLRTRLNAWTIDGHPMHSPDRRKAAQDAHNKVLQDLERTRVLERRAKLAAQLDQGASPAQIAGIAMLRSLFDSPSGHSGL